ncbi:MAG TPA: exo-alpha-sialidase [Candidatus Hydrogenedentes bacterium]|nr:exo-alpha-sialidase [Candidatus Hydrogenedentota bacterium]
MQKSAFLFCLLFALQTFAVESVEHGVVFFEEGRFAGWPANTGMWSWGDEIVCGFKLGYYKKHPLGGHDIDGDRPSVNRQARSLDGGHTWSVEIPDYIDDNDKERAVADLTAPVDFSNPDLAVKLRGDRVYYSTDRAKTWSGPHPLPHFGRPGLLARTDCIVEGKHRLTAFVAAEKEKGGEGQPLCIRTEDGGVTWSLVGWIGPQPPEGYGYAIMPATVALPGDAYLSIIRRGGVFDGKRRWWLEAFLSPDNGASWYLLDEPRVDNGGNPATLTRLDNGAIAMTYGWRASPYGIRARVSSDNGQTWSEEYILRADGASWDIGYPRTVQRSDGLCVTTYYYHTAEYEGRAIAYTIWNPAGE